MLASHLAQPQHVCLSVENMEVKRQPCCCMAILHHPNGAPKTQQCAQQAAQLPSCLARIPRALGLAGTELSATQEILCCHHGAPSILQCVAASHSVRSGGSGGRRRQRRMGRADVRPALFPPATRTTPLSLSHTSQRAGGRRKADRLGAAGHERKRDTPWPPREGPCCDSRGAAGPGATKLHLR